MKKFYFTDEDGCTWEKAPPPEVLERERLVRRIRLLRKTIEVVLKANPTTGVSETGWNRDHALLTDVWTKTAPKRVRNS